MHGEPAEEDASPGSGPRPPTARAATSTPLLPRAGRGVRKSPCGCERGRTASGPSVQRARAQRHPGRPAAARRPAGRTDPGAPPSCGPDHRSRRPAQRSPASDSGGRAEDRGQHVQHAGGRAHRFERGMRQHTLQKGDPPGIVVSAEPHAGHTARGAGGRIGIEPAELRRHRQRVAAQSVDPDTRHERAAEHVSFTLGALANQPGPRARIRHAQRRRRGVADRPPRARGGRHREQAYGVRAPERHRDGRGPG